MATYVSPRSEVHPKAQLGENVHIGPFCVVGKDVVIGAGTELDSHVVVTGNTTIGCHNRLFPGCVIGAAPQDKGWKDSHTRVEIGDHNLLREGVTINRGAEKEDGVTRVGSHNMLMANSHVAHNCHVRDHIILVNGVLLGGHVHVHDRAIVSGNSVVHHFSTIGTLAFVSGGCRVPHDVPPYMLAAGSDNPELKTLNLVGMQRAGIARPTIAVIKRAFRMLYREHKPLDKVWQAMHDELDGTLPLELVTLLSFVENQRKGKFGRGREGVRPETGQIQQRKAA